MYGGCKKIVENQDLYREERRLLKKKTKMIF